MYLARSLVRDFFGGAMPVSNAVRNFLESRAISFDVTPVGEATGFDKNRGLRTVLCKDVNGLVLVVVPQDEFIDIEQLRAVSGRSLRLVYADEQREVLADFDETGLVPLGALLGVSALFHDGIPRDGMLHFTSEDKTGVVSLTASALHGAQYREVAYLDISRKITPEWVAHRQQQQIFTRKRIESMLDDLQGLPAMPEMAERILHVAADANATAQHLAKVIEVDPSLSAQIISYATSAFYGYRGDITSVRDAISRVLGFELVANIAAGISLGTAFNVPADGPIGLSAFWRHAVYTSALAERLCKVVPRDRQASPGAAYLSGLLHDFGYLVLGHMLPAAFESLNQNIAANSTINVTTTESLILGMSHTDIGARLLQLWKLPDEAVIAARYHHTPDYRAEDAIYAHLVSLAEGLLHQQGVISDADKIPSDITRALLGLDAAAIEKAAQPVLDACAELDTLAQVLGR
jgi:HD-like signal output (HDOD) protein